MLKGFIRSIQSLSLIAFVSLINLIPEDLMALQFWTMAGGLILSCPFLYLGVPELRHLGRAAAELFFLPVQTIFYFVIPKADESKTWRTVKKWSLAFSIVKGLKMSTDKDDVEENEPSNQKRWSYQRQKTIERVGIENPTATFHPNTLDELRKDEGLKKKNKLSVTFVENILGMNNWLTQNPNEDRLLLARGPATCVKENIAVGVFLFSDVIIVARKLMKNRKYVVLVTIDVDANCEVNRDELEVTFKNGDKDFEVRFSQLGNARMWQQYVNYCKGSRTNSVDEDSSAELDPLLRS